MSASGWPEPSTGARSCAGRLRDLAAELVDLGDRLLQVALVRCRRRARSRAFRRVFGAGGPLFLHGGLRARGLPSLRHPLQPLEVDERLRPAQDLGRAQADEELLRRSRKRACGRGPVPTPWRTWASEPAPIVRLYLRAKRSGLVVEPFEEQPRVVDLEDVDLRRDAGGASVRRGSCAGGRRGGGGRRRRPARGSRRSSRPSACRAGSSRSRKSPMTSPCVRLHLLARDDDELAAARELDGLLARRRRRCGR